MVGDLAQFMVQNNLSAQQVEERAEELSFPSSVVEFAQGFIGEPYGGFPEVLRKKILKGLTPVSGRPGEHLKPLNFSKIKSELEEKHNQTIENTDVLSSALYPKVTDDFLAFRNEYGPVDLLDTDVFLYGPGIGQEIEINLEKGKTLNVKALACSETPNKQGEREVFFEFNGHLRTLYVKDKNTNEVSVFLMKNNSNFY